MKVYISVDMEGIAGVSHPNPTDAADSGYPAAVDLMVGEANAAIEGALAGGATEVLVNDSHGGMYNLRPADLHQARACPPGPEGVVDGRGRRARMPGSASRSSSATTLAPAIPPARSPTPSRAGRRSPG